MGNIVLIFGLWLTSLTSVAVADYHIYNVCDFGARGNGWDDDNQAFLKAWGEACADPNRSTFLVPSGREMTFLLSKITFEGPCKSEIHVQIGGNIVAQRKFWTNKIDTWITFINVNGLTVDGHGQIDGQGDYWWPCVSSRRCSSGPYILQFMGCHGLDLSGIYLKNSPGKHLAIHRSDWVKIHDLTITAPGDSPNTDGILVQESKHASISSSIIGVGDDCVALVTGCYDVNISSITCGPGHGISIGSLGANSSVEKVRVSNSNIFQTTLGVRIKTWQGGSGYARDITYEHITFTSVKVPIEIDQFYCPQRNCANKTSAVEISDVTYNDLHGTSVDPLAINLACSQIVKCNNIVLSNVGFTIEGSKRSQTQAYCHNVDVKLFGTVFPQVSCLN